MVTKPAAPSAYAFVLLSGASSPVMKTNGRRARAFVAAEAFGEREAVEHRHAHVEEDEVGALVEGAFEPTLAVLGLDHLEAGLDEARRAERPDSGVVVHDQYSERPLRPGTSALAGSGASSEDLHEPSSSTWHRQGGLRVRTCSRGRAL